MSKDKFCTWADANNFMMECTAFARGIPGMIDVAQRLESPLELVMLSAIKAAENYLRFRIGAEQESLAKLRELTGTRLSLRPAVPIGTYRADMVMHLQSLDEQLEQMTPVVIECDGFTYHDANRDQAIRDRARDRYMQRAGYIVARFAGDEIVEQPFACAFDAYDLTLRGLSCVIRDCHPATGWPVFTRGHAGRDDGPLTVDEFYMAYERMERASGAEAA